MLWKESPRARRGPRPALSVERIVEAAIALADEQGLEAVSMERVASGFRFTPMALYRYVPGKAELVDLMIDRGLGPPPVLAGDKDAWRAKLEQWARALWDVFHRHPWALEATQRLRLMGPHELAWLEAGLGALASTRLSLEAQRSACLVLLGHVRNTAQFSVTLPRGRGNVSSGQWGAATRTLIQDHAEQYPRLLAVLSAPPESGAREDTLTFGIQMVLDGIATRIAEREAGPGTRRRAPARKPPG
ncbi:TetR/AcrR family transcriptional regulator C-terminal domain-containing protein [Pyxidicoccus parkwayensis]|uniref:TetR/AcrR family transcriptional regulator C-terminal domain-containing protein n=1 Tax=Pyxidicoccus parkwayensis TaxID=2813578 RepID=A0ABX7P1I1_9BACT|nr:TetR/AcrR family transcriptional regulator [Pyxidicoccus parkwaysis]QSQ23791.1 TetR/AcrR family transcriptional regulator C-terminal domain-containing protein [Pyxidicoccus parkwaysis]